MLEKGDVDMKCNKCNYINTEDSLFCIKCGNQIRKRCNYCGKLTGLNSKFCEHCGYNFSTLDNVIVNSETNMVLENTNRDIQTNKTTVVSSTTDSNTDLEPVKKQKTNKIEFKKPENRRFVYTPGEYAYAKCVEITEKSYKFYCIDNYSNFYLSKKIIDSYLDIDIAVNTYIWVKLTDLIRQDNTCTYKVFIPNNKDIKKEINEFIKIHSEEDIIRVPISKIENSYIYVKLTPNYSSRIYEQEIKNGKYNVGDIITVMIKKIQKLTDNKVTVELSIIDKDTSTEMFLWDMLPKKLTKKNTFFPDRIKEIMTEREYWELFSVDESSSLFSIINPIYMDRYSDKKITTHQSGKYYYMEFDTGKRDEKGVPVYFCFKKDKYKENDKWVCNLIGFASAENEFEKYVYIRDWQQLLDDLSSMALKGEQWDLATDSEKGKKFILKQYLRFTYYKSRLDGLIKENENGAIFNTGLVDNSYDEIFCYLKSNSNTDDFYKREWEFGFFAPWGKGTNGKNINKWFAEKPKSPEYIKNLQDVFYDVSKELSCDYEHIIKDNLKRVPVEFLNIRLAYDKKITPLLMKYKNNPSDTTCFEKIVKYITANDKAFRELQFGFQNAVETAKKYCKWNYKTAIPIYYPRTNGISLLLPLCLNDEAENVADAALVIEKLPTGNYQGQTILTLDMAYQDARQICRPNSEWLTLDTISSYNTEDEYE